jgi:hypothetical protein
MSMYHRMVAGAAAALVLAGVWSVRAEDAKPTWNPELLVPSKQCQLCHKAANVGNQVAALDKGPHARAVETLKGDKAKAVAAKLGIDDPVSSPKCLKCHSTAYGFSEARVSDKVAVEEGVTCQSCHGPGKDYASLTKHAKDPEKSIKEFGLIRPTEANTCVRCHNDENPTINPEKYTRKDGTKTHFDFEQALEKIAHPRPAKK